MSFKGCTSKTGQSPYKKSQPARRSSTSSYGKGGGKQHFRKKTPKKKFPLKQRAYEVTFKKSVSSGAPSSGGNQETGNVSNSVLSGKGPEEEGAYNRFSCFAVNSKLADSSTNFKSKAIYTDTDPDNRSEIITDITIRMPSKAGTMMMEVKVDPGAQPSCINCINLRLCFLTYVGMDCPKKVFWTTLRVSSSPTTVQT